MGHSRRRCSSPIHPKHFAHWTCNTQRYRSCSPRSGLRLGVARLGLFGIALPKILIDCAEDSPPLIKMMSEIQNKDAIDGRSISRLHYLIPGRRLCGQTSRKCLCQGRKQRHQFVLSRELDIGNFRSGPLIRLRHFGQILIARTGQRSLSQYLLNGASSCVT